MAILLVVLRIRIRETTSKNQVNHTTITVATP